MKSLFMFFPIHVGGICFLQFRAVSIRSAYPDRSARLLSAFSAPEKPSNGSGDRVERLCWPSRIPAGTVEAPVSPLAAPMWRSKRGVDLSHDFPQPTPGGPRSKIRCPAVQVLISHHFLPTAYQSLESQDQGPSAETWTRMKTNPSKWG